MGKKEGRWSNGGGTIGAEGAAGAVAGVQKVGASTMRNGGQDGSDHKGGH